LRTTWHTPRGSTRTGVFRSVLGVEQHYVARLVPSRDANAGGRENVPAIFRVSLFTVTVRPPSPPTAATVFFLPLSFERASTAASRPFFHSSTLLIYIGR
jgi:hypothetical protein